MINIFDCSSVENYLCEILEFSLNVEKVSIAARVNSILPISTTILDREYNIAITCPAESDIQFGYKLVNAAIDALEIRGIEHVASHDFIRLRSVYKTLTNRLPLIYEPPLLGWFFPDENYRMAILCGLIKEIELWEKVELILPVRHQQTL
jgi:hypothetical protein